MDLDDLLDEVLNDPRNGGVNAGQPKQASFQPPAEQSQQIRYSEQNNAGSYQPKQQVATNNPASQMQSNNFGGSGYGVRSSVQAAAANGVDSDDDWDAEEDQPAPS